MTHIAMDKVTIVFKIVNGGGYDTYSEDYIVEDTDHCMCENAYYIKREDGTKIFWPLVNIKYIKVEDIIVECD